MDHLHTAEAIEALLECDRRVAESIERQCRMVGICDVADVQKIPDDVYTILRMCEGDQKEYYVFLGAGYFLEQIRKGSGDGERIYRAIE